MREAWQEAMLLLVMVWLSVAFAVVLLVVFARLLTGPAA